MSRYLDGTSGPGPISSAFPRVRARAVVGAGALSARLFAIQVAGTTPYTALAADTRTVREPLPSTRGVIFDRNGPPLVSNTASYSVKVRPSDLPESRRVEVVQRLHR